MKLSEVTPEIILRYLKVEPDGLELYEAQAIKDEVRLMFQGAKSYIKSYTGLDYAAMDEYEEISIAALALCSDMYEQRIMTVNSGNVNRTVQSILDMHRQNMLK